jgi:cytochrome c biogenesis factor
VQDHRLARRVGWLLYLGSMLTPAVGRHIVGAQAFVLAPKAILLLLESRPSSPLAALGLITGLAANALVIVRVSPFVCFGALLAPWVAWIDLDWHARGFSLTGPFAVTFYFPWAIGIALIHSALGKRG